LYAGKLFGTGTFATFGILATEPDDPLFIDLTKDLHDFHLFFNGYIKQPEGVGQEITLYLSIDLCI
jgi:hypothetical protein